MFHLSKETVRNHVRHILLRLGAHSRLEAVARAHELGLLGG
jgi:DNA-binding NarL/FixJ family response regulator